MKNNKLSLIIVITIITAVGAIFITTSSQSQSKTARQQKLEQDIPTVDINAPDVAHPQESRLRKKRGQKYNTGSPLKDEANPRNEILELPLTHAKPKIALPVTQSDAIVIGTIADAQAFLSDDKSYVYSEFAVKVEEILKNVSSTKLNPTDLIITERSGGAVRFSSGKTKRLGNFGEGFPAKQKRYLLFLKRNELGEDFFILTGYKLQDGKVTPLDDSDEYEDVHIYKNFRLYRNKDEADFVKTVRDEIANPSQEESSK